jgi:hypothetical protein
LTESINSMFNWYREAAVCYVFLEDFPANFEIGDRLYKCRWFTRGWTLQELLAPECVEFYDQNWNFLGAKRDLDDIISTFTKIPEHILQYPNLVRYESIAVRMSWASHRETKRKEDMAYCLLGIFDVNMPLIYGEGTKAFRRLQEEIIKRDNDFTIFGWNNVLDDQSGIGDLVGVFASSPAAFAASSGLHLQPKEQATEFSLTNRGLSLAGGMLLSCRVPHAEKAKSGYFLAIGDSPGSVTREIPLRKLTSNLYCRIRDPEIPIHRLLCDVKRAKFFNSAYIVTDFHHLDVAGLLAPPRREALHVPKQRHLRLVDATPESLWDDTDAIFLHPQCDFLHTRYPSKVAVEFLFSVDTSYDYIGVVYDSEPKFPCLRVFRSRVGDSKRDLTSTLHDKEARDPRDGDKYKEWMKQGPWYTSYSSPLELKLGSQTFNVTFWLEASKLKVSGMRHHDKDIPVVSLNSKVDLISARSETAYP